KTWAGARKIPGWGVNAPHPPTPSTIRVDKALQEGLPILNRGRLQRGQALLVGDGLRLPVEDARVEGLGVEREFEGSDRVGGIVPLGKGRDPGLDLGQGVVEGGAGADRVDG